MNLPWIKDPGTKEPSITITLYVVGFLVGAVKLLISGITIHGIHMGEFSGVDFAAVVVALGGVYTARRHSDAIQKKE